MKIFPKKLVAVVLTATMVSSVNPPAFAAEFDSLAPLEIEQEFKTIDTMNPVQVPTLTQLNGEQGTYSVMNSSNDSTLMWQETYSNVYTVNHNLQCSWLLTDPTTYLNIYLQNKGESTIRVTLMKDGAGGGSNELAGTPYDLSPNESKLFQLQAHEFVDTYSNVAGYGNVVVYCTNMDYKPISLTARAVFY